MQIVVVTLFPEFVEQALKCGVLGRAIERGVLAVETVNPRQYATDVHKTVDDRPFGGGPGMVRARATEVVRTPEGFRIDAGAGTNCTIEDRRGDDRGFVLSETSPGGTRWTARTSRPAGFEAAPTLLLADGRLFRIRIRSLAPPRVELHGDAVVGAYLEATPAGDAWEIVTTRAGERLSPPPALLWLFGAEVARLA